MPFDFASVKALARQVVQATFGVRAYYSDVSVDTPVEIRVRWHNKLSRPFGDLENGGYAEVIEGIDRIVLIPKDVDGYPVTLRRLGVISNIDGMPDVELILEMREPADGPLEEAWTVTRK